MANQTITIDLDLNPSEAAKALLQYAQTQADILAELRAIRALMERRNDDGAPLITSGSSSPR